MSKTRSKWRRIGTVTSATVISRPASCESDVTPSFARPHGTIASYHDRSVVQFSANPCSVTRARMSRTPIAHTFRSPDHTPVDEVELGAGLADPVLGPGDVLRLPPAAGRVDRRMLQEDQGVRDVAGQASLRELVHGGVRRCVRHEPWGAQQPA